MRPVLNSAQVREVDAYTIANEPIASIDLMERASRAFVQQFLQLAEKGRQILIFAGVGNNGGDALAVARLLLDKGIPVQVYTIGDRQKSSLDFRTNLDRLNDKVTVTWLEGVNQFPRIAADNIVIDGLFGSGLTRPVTGLFAQLISHINEAEGLVFSIDIASGLPADSLPEGGTIIQPRYTISFHVPKPAFFQPQLERYVGEWHVVDIGLHQGFIEGLSSHFYLTESNDFAKELSSRSRFSHKGNAGRLLVVAGSKGKMGAAVLAAKGGLRAGAGLVYVHAPSCGTDILQVSVPEAMVVEDSHADHIEDIFDIQSYTAVAIGPGIGMNNGTRQVLADLLNHAFSSLVMDADAINLLADNRELLDLLPAGCILTPHPGEFKRLVGEWADDYEKLEKLRNFCMRHQVNMVLKGAYSAVCSAEGKIHFNPTGNPGMATGGSGDVLTGILGGLLAQGMAPFNALRLGVYLHGLAGDLACEQTGQHAMIASDLIRFLPAAFQQTVSLPLNPIAKKS